MKWRPLVACAVAAAVMAAGGVVSRSEAAPASDAHTRQTVEVLRVGLSPPISSLDTHRLGNAAWVNSLALEQLVQVGSDGKLVPWLATRVSQPGRLIYVYHLRRGVRFWNGKEMTATDVASALNYYRFRGSQVASQYAEVRQVRALDRYRVAITLRRPDATVRLLPTRYGTKVFEKAFADEHREAMGRPDVLTMGTGPWRIASFALGSGIELTANDRHWRGKPLIRRISVKFFADENSMALAFRAGEIDVAPLVTSPRAFAATSGAKLVSVPSCQFAVFSMNTQVAPWNDLHVRRAVAYALNRTDLIQANGGFATPNYTLISPTLLRMIGSKSAVDGLLRSLPQYRFDLAKARQEMARSASPRGFSTTLPTIAPYSNITQVIAAQLDAIGIKAQVQVLPTVAAWVGVLTGPTDRRPPIFLPSGCTLVDPHQPTYLLGARNLRQGSFNVANYAPPEIDTLINAGVGTTNPTKRLNTYGKLLRRLATDVPYVPLWVQNANLAISERFTWPTFDANWLNRVWALEIKPKR